MGLDVTFTRVQDVNYDDKSHSFAGGFTQRLTDWWTFSGSYVFTVSEGENASGSLAADFLGRAENEIDNLDHIASASTEISLGDGWGVVGEYTFEGFEDDVDHDNDGHINTFMMSIFMTR